MLGNLVKLFNSAHFCVSHDSKWNVEKCVICFSDVNTEYLRVHFWEEWRETESFAIALRKTPEGWRKSAVEESCSTSCRRPNRVVAAAAAVFVVVVVVGEISSGPGSFGRSFLGGSTGATHVIDQVAPTVRLAVDLAATLIYRVEKGRALSPPPSPVSFRDTETDETMFWDWCWVSTTIFHSMLLGACRNENWVISFVYSLGGGGQCSERLFFPPRTCQTRRVHEKFQSMGY